MKTRFRASDVLCKLQELIGVLVIVADVIFLGASISASNQPGAPPAWMVAAIVAGLLFLGLQIIAMAQVYQCLMQIGINTCYAAPAAPPAPEVARAIGKPLPTAPTLVAKPSPPPEPRTEPQSFSITGEPRN